MNDTVSLFLKVYSSEKKKSIANKKERFLALMFPENKMLLVPFPAQGKSFPLKGFEDFSLEGFFPKDVVGEQAPEFFRRGGWRFFISLVKVDVDPLAYLLFIDPRRKFPRRQIEHAAACKKCRQILFL